MKRNLAFTDENSVNSGIEPPDQFELTSISPNPFNQSTIMRFSSADYRHVLIEIYEMKGNLVAVCLNSPVSAGTHLAHWDGRSYYRQSMPTGLYLVVIKTANDQVARNIVLIR